MIYRELITEAIIKAEEYEARNNKKPIGFLMCESTKDYMIKGLILDFKGIVKVETLMGIKIFISEDQDVGQINLIV